MRRLVITALIALPVFLLLSWWNAIVGVLFGIAAITWVLTPVYFRYSGQQSVPWVDDLKDGESPRDARHRKFFE